MVSIYAPNPSIFYSLFVCVNKRSISTRRIVHLRISWNVCPFSATMLSVALAQSQWKYIKSSFFGFPTISYSRVITKWKWVEMMNRWCMPNINKKKLVQRKQILNRRKMTLPLSTIDIMCISTHYRRHLLFINQVRMQLGIGNTMQNVKETWRFYFIDKQLFPKLELIFVFVYFYLQGEFISHNNKFGTQW